MPTHPTTASPKTQFNMRFSPELLSKLDAYAEMVGQSKTQIAANAIEDYLTWRVPLSVALNEAVEQANRGEFADPKEVERFFDEHED
jgi:predicted transcriptional regulator